VRPSVSLPRTENPAVDPAPIPARAPTSDEADPEAQAVCAFDTPDPSPDNALVIHGAHVIVYSTNAEADRAFFRDVLQYPSVDAGHGWLIFALPPAEVAVHPSDENGVHELYLMCDDVHAMVAEMRAKKVECSPIDEQRWGSITRLTLPGGAKIAASFPNDARAWKSDKVSDA
jgi:hypothetical protein